jgi:uncharacterized protein with HEPN domain
MSNISHKDFACLLNIKEAIEKIYEYTADHRDADTFNNDSKSFDAVMMNFVVIGEMSEKLSDEFRIETDKEIDWFKIRGFRNIIAHNYFGIDAEEVWQIIKNSLTDLEREIIKIIEK